MSEHEHGMEKHHAFIEELRADLTQAYVDMLARLNHDVATELKRARGFQKSGGLFVIPGGKGTFAPLGVDLLKADAPSAPHVKAPKVAAPKAKGDKPEEIKHPGSRGGKWYRDDHGHVKYGTRPTERFHTALTEEDEQQLHTSVIAIAQDLSFRQITDLSNIMDVDEGALTSLQDAIKKAYVLGVAPEDLYVKAFVDSFADDHDEDGNGIETPELRSEALEIYADVLSKFKNAATSDTFRKQAQKILVEQKAQSILLKEKFEAQKKVVGGHFLSFLTGDISSASIKQLAMLWDLGVFQIPSTEAIAKRFVPSDVAKSAIDTVVVDEDRMIELARNMQDMSPEQLFALRVARRVQDEIQTRLADPNYDSDAYWQDEDDTADGPIAQSFRSVLANHGATFTFSDDEWEKIESLVTSTAHAMCDTINARNMHQGGEVVNALHHGKTSVKAVFKNEKVVATLAQLGQTTADQIRRSLEAQENTSYKINDAVLEGMRKSLGDPNADLFGFQKSAVAWMHAQKRGILAYDAGLGKTPISIAFAADLLDQKKIKRCILILPPSLVNQWPKEIEKFRPGSKVQVLGSEILGTQVLLDQRLAMLEAINNGDLDADFVIMSSGTVNLTEETKEKVKRIADDKEAEIGRNLSQTELNQLVEEAGLFENDPLVQAMSKLEGAVLVDEAHHATQGLKNPNNQHYHIMKHVLGDREYAFGMTATPMPNEPLDLFHMSNLFVPGSAGESAEAFEDRMINTDYAIDPETGKATKVVAYKDMQDLKAAKIRLNPYVFFRRKSDKRILDEMASRGMKLPEVEPVAHGLTLDPASQAVYDACGSHGYDDDPDVIPYSIDEKGNLVGRDPEYKTDSQMVEELESRHLPPKLIDMIMRNRYSIRKRLCAISPKLVDRRYTGPQPKIDHTVDIVKRHFNNPANADRPIIIFGDRIPSLDLMREELVKAGMPKSLIGTITGEVEKDERSAVQEAINAGKMKVVLIGVKAGGAGLNLQGKIDRKTGKKTGSYRAVFLDKPWTPADLTQAIGRVYRTGNPEDRVYIHHMKVAGTTDEAKYDKLRDKISITDSLAFADLGEEFVSKEVIKSVKELLGSFDEDIKEWTPEQEKELLQMAGLEPGDVLPLPSIPSMREDFDIAEFGKQVEHEDFKRVGDSQIETLNTLNEVLHKTKRRSKEEYANAKRKIARYAYDWMNAVNAAMTHQVARFTKDEFLYGTPGQSEVLHSRETVGKLKVKHPVIPKGKKVKEAVSVGAWPLKSAQKKPFKLGAESAFSLKTATKNPYKKGTSEWAMWNVVRRNKPGSVKEAIKHAAKWLVEEDKSFDSLRTAEKYLWDSYPKRKWFEKFARDGLIEVQ